MMTVRSSFALAVALSVLGSAACSIVNAPEKVAPAPDTTGAGGSGTTTTAECTTAEDCDPNFRCSGRLCTDGKCTIGQQPNVDDKDKCTLDACDPKTGPTHTKVDPDDKDACTTDTCNAKTGPVHTPINPDDDDACTVDSCDAKTGVKHVPLAGIDDGNFCHENTCDPATGAISHTPKHSCACEHSVCDDDNGSPGGSVALDAKTCTFGPTADCVSSVCLKSAACCSIAWTKDCKALAMDPTVCGAAPGAFTCTCSHDFSCPGLALYKKCDPCVKVVCDAMPECCDKAWSPECVAATQQLCNAPANLTCP